MTFWMAKRFNDIFQKLSSISIDGFKRERYVIKIQHMTNEVVKAQEELLQEEKEVESGVLSIQDKQSLAQSIQRITDLMLKIETLTADKAEMEATLKEKEQKWIQNDRIFKQRRIILNYIVKLNLQVRMQEYAAVREQHDRLTSENLSGKAYELVYFMIQHILAANRIPAVNFIAEINSMINSSKEEMDQLQKTQFELTGKVLAIEEEKREMRKKIDEMRQICDLKEAKDSLTFEIGA